MSDQLTMTGDDWISDRDRTRQRKAEAARHAAGMRAATTLRKAADALKAYLQACRECQDGSDDSKRGGDDTRHTLRESLCEYADFLEMRHKPKGGAA